MKRLPAEDRAGIYITVIVHLVVLIILLGGGLGYSLQKENSFVLDFTKAEEKEQQQKEDNLKKAISERIDEILAGGNTYVRNVAVDRSVLKDDRNSSAEADQLYKDAERLQRELNKGFSAPDEDDVAEPAPISKSEKKAPVEAKYSGPSVLSYYLEGRKASSLPIPAYRCMGAGQVKVIIRVNPQGTVQSVKIDEGSSSSDGCLRNFAIRAARMSKFSMSSGAPALQDGYIIYQFIAQ